MENSWVEPEQREERKFRILQNIFESFFWTNQMDFRGIILIDPHNLRVLSCHWADNKVLWNAEFG